MGVYYDNEPAASIAARNQAEAASCAAADRNIQPELPINPNTDYSQDWTGDDRRDRGGK